MATRCRTTLGVLALASAAVAAEPYRDGWSEKTLGEASAACTETLVQGAWANTKRDQGLDPKRELTPELREQLAPQIEAFRTLCGCTVRETAKKFGRSDYERKAGEVERYTVELIDRGTCKAPGR